MRHDEVIAGGPARLVAAGPMRCRGGRSGRRPWARGRLALLLGAALGAPWLPIPDHPADGPAMHRVRGRPGLMIRAIALAPDGRTVAALDECEGVRLLPASEGEGLGPCRGAGERLERSPDGRAWAVAFSPCGRTLAKGGVGPGVALYELTPEGRERPLGVPVRDVSDLRFSPDGRALAVSSRCSREIFLWDVEADRPRMILEENPSPVSALAFSPDGRTLAAAASTAPAVLIWDLDTGRLRHRLDQRGVFCLTFSPDGRTLAAVNGWETAVPLWDARTGTRLAPVADRSVSIRWVAFSPDGLLLATAASDGTAGLWDLATGRERWRLDGRAHTLGQVVFAPDGRTLIATGHDDTIRLWDLGSLIPR